MKIFHTTQKKQWEKTKNNNCYHPLSLDLEGFIHASTSEQILPTLNRIFRGKTDLVLLVIDTERVESKIKYEYSSRSGEKHPHIYGEVPMISIESIYEIKPGKDGSFKSLPFKKV